MQNLFLFERNIVLESDYTKRIDIKKINYTVKFSFNSTLQISIKSFILN